MTKVYKVICPQNACLPPGQCLKCILEETVSLHLMGLVGFPSLDLPDCFLKPHTFFASATPFDKLCFTS